MRSEFLFKLLDDLGPANRLSRLTGIGDVVAEERHPGSDTDNMIGLQMCALNIRNRAGE